MERDPVFEQEPDPSPAVPWSPGDVLRALVMVLLWILVFVLIGWIGQRLAYY